MKIFVILFFFLNLIVNSYGAKILGVVSSPSFSHQSVFRPIWKELLNRGHEVMVLAADSMLDVTTENFTEIIYKYDIQKWGQERDRFTQEVKNNPYKLIDGYIKFMSNVVDSQLQHANVQTLINNKTVQFDLVIVEYLLPIALAFGDKFNCPMIGVITMPAPSVTHRVMGNPSHPVLSPDVYMACIDTQTFYCRVFSVLYTVVLEYFYQNNLDYWKSIIHKNFGQDSSTMEEIFSKVDMLFVNSNPVFHGIRPMVPTVVSIGGGIHIKEPQELPKDLKTFLDNATDGFIYFSLGGTANSASLPHNIQTVLIETFSELPYKILWKYKSNSSLGISENVHTLQWIPQQDVLRHPNIKLFVSQCGLQSVEEALYNKVPILAMPLFADQPINAKLIVSKGMGLSVEYEHITKDELKSIIIELIENPKYRIRMEELQNLVTDQPMNSLEKAIWWIEYVIRHKGAKHLRSSSLDIPTYQYFLVDVIGFCLVIIAILFYILFKLTKFVGKISKRFLNRKKVKTS